MARDAGGPSCLPTTCSCWPRSIRTLSPGLGPGPGGMATNFAKGLRSMEKDLPLLLQPGPRRRPHQVWGEEYTENGLGSRWPCCTHCRGQCRQGDTDSWARRRPHLPEPSAKRSAEAARGHQAWGPALTQPGGQAQPQTSAVEFAKVSLLCPAPGICVTPGPVPLELSPPGLRQ